MNCRRAYFLVVAGELLWLSLLGVTPYLAAKGHILSSNLLYYFFSHFCHQRPERSLFLFGEQLPVCARDTSLYIAAFLATIAYPHLKDMCTKALPSKWYLVTFLLPIAIDGSTQLFGLRESTNLLRVITGFWAGLIVPFYFIPLVMASSSLSVDVEDGQGSNGEGVDDITEGYTKNGDEPQEYEHQEYLYHKEEQEHQEDIKEVVPHNVEAL